MSHAWVENQWKYFKMIKINKEKEKEKEIKKKL